MTQLILFAIGIYWIVTGLRIATCPRATLALIDTFEENHALTFMGGIVLLFVGIALLWQHNLWTTPKEIFASFILWTATIEGALMIAAPGILFWIGRKMFPSVMVFRIIGFIMAPAGLAVVWWAFH